jgi:hypothetical protein
MNAVYQNINVREIRRGNQEWTIRRYWQKHNTAQKIKKMSNTKNQG